MPITDDVSLIRYHEGLTLVAKPDKSIKGTSWVIGYGRDIPAPPDPGNPPTCTAAQADDWLINEDAPLARHRACTDVGPATWAALDPVRRAVLVDMAYEIGGAGLAGFRDMLVGFEAQDWPEAALQLETSKLYGEVKSREQMNVQMILSGQWPQTG